MTVDVYNSVGGTTAPSKNLFGFITSDGKEYLADSKSHTANTWDTETVTFKLSEATDGYFSIGYTSTNAGNGSQQHLFYDNIKLTYTAPTEDDYNTALTAAQNALANDDYKNVTGSESTALVNALSEYADVTSDYQTAIDALTKATNAFIAAKASYDAYATYANSDQKTTDDAALKALDATAPSAPTTAAEAAEYEHNVNVAEYTAVKDNYTTTIELGDWTTTGNVVDNKGQHWSGDASRTYKEQSSSDWGSSSWSISLSQSKTLPAGKYVFKAAGRKQSAATLALTVKAGETTMEVTNYPVGDTGYGIDTEGAANFNESGTYTNDNKGRGFQWRFVPFELTEETEVTISVNASASTQYQWVSFCDYTVQGVPNTAASTLAYTEAYTAAQTALANTDYANVTGSERKTLTGYGENPTGTTASDIDTETENLKAATTAFTAAKTSYDALVAAKETADPNLEYASEDAKQAFADAKNVEATYASDADTKTAAITTALRAYYESNSKGELYKTDDNTAYTDYTSSIQNPNAEATTGWTATQTDGGASISIKSDAPFTDASGNSTHSYFDGGNWNGSDWTTKYDQTISGLPAGKYLLAVTARGSSDLRWFRMNVNENYQVDLKHTGSTQGTGTFDRGWEDNVLEFTTNGGDVTISIRANAQKAQQWQSFTRFRLTKIGDLETVELKEDASAAPAATDDYVNVTYNRTFKQGWNSIVLPFDATLTELGASDAIEYAGTSGTTINFNTITSLAANTPYMVYFDEAKTDATTFSGKTIADTENETLTTTDATGSQYNFVGTYVQQTGDNSPITSDDYVVVSDGIQKAAGGNTLKAFRAYFDAQSASAAKSLTFTIDGNVVTGVKAVELQNAVNDGAVYNLAGQRVSDSYKGVVIKNGKKYVK